MVPPLCHGNIEFFDLETFSRLFVECTIQGAIEIINIRQQSERIAINLLGKPLFTQGNTADNSNDIDKSIDESLSSVSSIDIIDDTHNKLLNEWPNIGLFSKTNIINYIKQFLSKWKLIHNWMYCIHFICEERNKCSDFYFYDVKWSVPTKQYPIPQVTASVYFQIEVPRCKPKCSPINVSYLFEGSGLLHKPYKIQFNEEWLLSILDNKIRFISTLKF